MIKFLYSIINIRIFIYNYSIKKIRMTEPLIKKRCIEKENNSSNPEKKKHLDNGIFIGKDYAIAFNQKRDLYGWGENFCGELGIGKIKEQDTPILIANLEGYKWEKIIVCFRTTFGITQSGETYVWGDHFDKKFEMSKRIYIPELLDTPENEKWKDIVAGVYSNFGFTESEKVYSWGSNFHGVLGLGKIKITLYEMKELKPPSNDDKWSNIIPAYDHCFGITKNGNVYGWGNPRCGKLGFKSKILEYYPVLLVPPKGDRWKEISTGESHSFGMTEKGKVYTWGQNYRGQLGLGGKGGIRYRASPKLLESPKGEQWEKVICGENHSLGITKNNNVYVWGDNLHNQLGLGLGSKIKEIYSPKLLNPPKGEKWAQIMTKTNSSFAFTQSHKLYVWGNNMHGQLGLGRCGSRWEPTLLKLEDGYWYKNMWYLIRILFIARLKEPSSGFYKENLPLDIFKFICNMI